MQRIRKDKLILTESDLLAYGTYARFDGLRKELLQGGGREHFLLIQGAAFVLQGKAFLLLGVGGIDFLDSLGHLDGVEGIIGNGNALYLSRDFKYVYSAHTTEELARSYELEDAGNGVSFAAGAPIGPVIFLLRSFRRPEEYTATRAKVLKRRLVFEQANTFAAEPLHFCGSLKSRLRQKFLATTRIVHCARRPTLMEKECLFDSYDEVRAAIDRFRGYFCLVYTLWSQEMCDAVGMRSTRALSRSYNPTDPVTPHIVQIAARFPDV